MKGSLVVNREQEAFFSALASKTRLIIIELLCKRPRNISELAQALDLSATIAARHIQILEKAGIVRCERVQGDRGLQKICEMAMTGLALTFEREAPSLDVSAYDIPLGQYAAWSVRPTCGLLTPEGILGCYDDPRYFADPGRFRVACLWVGHGYLEYVLPNYLNALQALKEVSVQMEICSEAPGYAESWPSDIHFSLNGRLLG
ncbi:MAG TPA: ArsR family transcriptional regulator, partial [Clostridia bacterium]|nr:ArsR family transcriptional regulator [Clostridia bacterium]